MTLHETSRRADGSPGTLKLLTTGGTIATRLDPATGRTAPALGAAEIARLAPGLERAEVLELRRTPSWAMTIADMASIARSVGAALDDEDVAGVVVTVGTTTLEYVSFVSDLYVDATVPVVFTGAMRKADEADPDGPANLADAVRVAGSPEAAGRGVLVCFAGKILSARGCWKMARSANNAFLDTDGSVGVVDGDGPHFLRVPPTMPRLRGTPVEGVEIVKVFPGAEGDLLDAVAARGVRGVVIEGLPGAGGIPPKMFEALERLAATDTVVVVSSRAPSGSVPNPPTGGTGSPLADLPLLSAGSLTTEKAWIALSAALGEGGSLSAVRARFSSLAEVGP
ncbi:asparaginase [Nocardioides sp. YIM 152315]|uniref:asparaginase n=1 Tax=Nocardioides sp. YIM 152315 TaxID=3031760 RepID=UPI0023DB1569|nr:asparaginase [Nocardioides sp. YIM 152315]MDF1605820.1 asparaginase [Nocardioides sp. YIM 152315]